MPDATLTPDARAARIALLEELLEDRLGEASACVDPDCSCKSSRFDIEDELEQLRGDQVMVGFVNPDGSGAGNWSEASR